MCKNHAAHGATPSHRHLPKGVSRRDVLKLTAATAGIAALGPWRGLIPVAHGAPLAKKRLVVLNLYGGNDTMNMVIPDHVQPYFDRRGTMAIQAAESLPLTGGPGHSDFRLHPELMRIQSLWNDGDVAFVQRTGYPSANLSHFTSQDIFSRGVRNDFPGDIPPSGWIARFADRNAPTPLGAVSLGVGRRFDFAGGSSKPFLVQSLTGFKLSGGTGRSHLHRAETAKKILDGYAGGVGNTAEARDALDQAYQLADQIQDSVAAYSSSVDYSYFDPTRNRQYTPAIAARLRDMATLIQQGFETSIFFSGYGGFDTHGDQRPRHADLLRQLDRSIGAFSEDMKLMGTWEDMVICVVTEFGRRNFVNGSDGSDHGHGYCTMLVGGGVRGAMHGDITETDVNRNYPLHAVDFRDIYREVMRDHMSATDLDYVFPENNVPNPLTLIG